MSVRGLALFLDCLNFRVLVIRVNSRLSNLGWQNGSSAFRLDSRQFSENQTISRPDLADFTARWLGLHFAGVLARRVQTSRPQARLPAIKGSEMTNDVFMTMDYSHGMPYNAVHAVL